MGVSRASTQAADGMWQITKFSELNMLTKTQGILQKEGWKEARPKGACVRAKGRVPLPTSSVTSGR